jgi:hypothetical protein
MADTFLMIVNSALIAWMPSFERGRGAGVKDLPRSGDAVVLGVPGMDPGLEVQVLCGAAAMDCQDHDLLGRDFSLICFRGLDIRTIPKS